MAGLIAIEIKLQKAAGFFVRSVYRTLEQSNSIEDEEQDDNYFLLKESFNLINPAPTNAYTLMDEYLVLCCRRESHQINPSLSKSHFTAFLGMALFGEVMLLNSDFLKFSLKKPSITSPIGDVKLQVIGSPPSISDPLIEEAALIIKLHEKDPDTAIDWCRKFGKWTPLFKTIKKLNSRAIQLSVDKGVLRREIKKGIIKDSALYYPNEEFEKEVIDKIRGFALFDAKPTTSRDMALFAMFYTVDHFYSDQISCGFDKDKIFSKGEIQQARKNMKNFFKTMNTDL